MLASTECLKTSANTQCSLLHLVRTTTLLDTDGSGSVAPSVTTLPVDSLRQSLKKAGDASITCAYLAPLLVQSSVAARR